MTSELELIKAHYKWLETYTWIKPNGECDYINAYVRPKSQFIDPRESYYLISNIKYKRGITNG